MPEIDRIIVVLNPDEFDVFRDEIAVPYGLTDIEVVAGGADRQSSVYEGLPGAGRYARRRGSACS